MVLKSGFSGHSSLTRVSKGPASSTRISRGRISRGADISAAAYFKEADFG
jgi:hypothetical protein